MWFGRKRRSGSIEELKLEHEELCASLNSLQAQIDELDATAADINSKLAAIKALGEERDAQILFGGTDVQVSEIRN